MSDFSVARIGAFDRVAGAAKALVVEPGASATRFVFRGKPAAQAAIVAAFGVSLPLEACRAAVVAERAALWLGPDEWLLIVEGSGAEDGRAEELFAGLEQALAAIPHSLVDVSHRNVALKLSGPKAAAAINTACPLDMSLAAFPVGMCTRTIFGKAEVIIWRTGADQFHLETWRSFGAYLWGLIGEAQCEYGVL